ncbi:hypothetical protein DIPPA_02559 [Diplonema papillatum]|nr:hypothetical protein DIPPA_02559 [Diplonema papillatum]
MSEDILTWLRVRLSVGLNVTDRAANEFFATHVDEAAQWQTALREDPQRHVAIYFTHTAGPCCATPNNEAAPEEDMSLFKFNLVEWNSVDKLAGKINFMIFYPKLRCWSESGGDQSTGDSQPPDQRMDDVFAWSVLSSVWDASNADGSACEAPVFPVSEQWKHDAGLRDWKKKTGPATGVMHLLDHNNTVPKSVVDEWGIELGAALAGAAGCAVGTQDPMEEILFWQQRLRKLRQYEARLLVPEVADTIRGNHHSQRWPTLRAHLLMGYEEAAKRVADVALLMKPLRTVANTLPSKTGIFPLSEAAHPFHVALFLLSGCSRAQIPQADLERLYTKVANTIIHKALEYLDVGDLFSTTSDELDPQLPPDSYGTNRPAPLRCTQLGRERLENVSNLIKEWTSAFEQVSSWSPLHDSSWPDNRRRMFLLFRFVLQRCADVEKVLEDLVEEQPDIIEDRAGYRRYRKMVKMLQDIDFDIFDIGHKANWRVFQRRWDEAVEDKLEFPEGLDETSPLMARCEEPHDVNELLPLQTALTGFSPVVSLDERFDSHSARLPDAERVLCLQQEKQVLTEKLQEAAELLAQDRTAIGALTEQYDGAKRTIAALSAEVERLRKTS